MPLIAKASGTNVAGATFCSPRELAITSRIDTTAVPITIVGSVVTSRFARYSASRVALPAMNCALTAAEQIIAMMTAGSDRVGDDLIRTVGVRGMRDVGALEPLAARRTGSWYHPPPPRLRGAVQEQWTAGRSREFGASLAIGPSWPGAACVDPDKC